MTVAFFTAPLVDGALCASNERFLAPFKTGDLEPLVSLLHYGEALLRKSPDRAEIRLNLQYVTVLLAVRDSELPPKRAVATATTEPEDAREPPTSADLPDGWEFIHSPMSGFRVAVSAPTLPREHPLSRQEGYDVWLGLGPVHGMLCQGIRPPAPEKACRMVKLGPYIRVDPDDVMALEGGRFMGPRTKIFLRYQHLPLEVKLPLAEVEAALGLVPNDS